MLVALLSRCNRLKHSFFSLIALCTSSFHHQVSLASRLLPLVTPNTSEATFRTQIAIFSHMLFAYSSSSQGPLFSTLLKSLCHLPSKRPPLRSRYLGVLVPSDTYMKAKVRHHKLMLRDN